MMIEVKFQKFWPVVSEEMTDDGQQVLKKFILAMWTR